VRADTDQLACQQLRTGGLTVEQHGAVMDRKGGVVKVKGPHGEGAWYQETELQLASFDKKFISQACVQDGVLGVRFQHSFEPVGGFQLHVTCHCTRTQRMTSSRLFYIV